MQVSSNIIQKIKLINIEVYIERTLLGHKGRLIEIMNEEDQELAVNLTKRAENNFEECDQLSFYCPEFWWSGLVHLKSKDQTWIWIESDCRHINNDKLICNFRWKRS